MPTLEGFGTFAALREEQISEKVSRRILSGDQGMIVWWRTTPLTIREELRRVGELTCSPTNAKIVARRAERAVTTKGRLT